MITKTIHIQEITVDEFADKVADRLLIKIQQYLEQLSTNNSNDVYLTRNETCEFLKISSQTLWNWSKKGIIKPSRIGNRLYYNKKELLELLDKMS